MGLNMSTFAELLEETYAIASLPTKEQIKYRLVKRYADKVSKHLLDFSKDALKRGKALHAKQMQELICGRDRAFMRLIEPDKNWQGGTVHVPITFNKKED